MTTYAIDSERQAMLATGIVEPVMQWEETPDGRRRPSQLQDRDEATGMPLWGFEVSYRTESFGRESTVTAKVTVGAAERPEPATFTPVTFEVLRVEVRTNKANGFSERWSAEAVKAYTPANQAEPKPAESKPGSSGQDKSATKPGTDKSGSDKAVA